MVKKSILNRVLGGFMKRIIEKVRNVRNLIAVLGVSLPVLFAAGINSNKVLLSNETVAPTSFAILGEFYQNIYYRGDGASSVGSAVYYTDDAGVENFYDINPEGGYSPNGFEIVNVGSDSLIFFITNTTDPATYLFSIDKNNTLNSLTPSANSFGGSKKIVGFKNQAYFIMDDQQGAGNQLFRSNGVAVEIAADLYGLHGATAEEVLFSDGAYLYFLAGEATNGIELWRTDGTEANTQVYMDISAGVGHTFWDYGYAVKGDKVLAEIEKNCWSDCGSTEVVIIDLSLKQVNAVTTLTDVEEIITTTTGFAFQGINATQGAEAWQSDGTIAGTKIISDVFFGTPSSQAKNFFEFEGDIYFNATDGANGYELYRYSGTATDRITDETGTASTDPTSFVIHNNELYYAGYSAVNGHELRLMDSTFVSQLVIDIRSGVTSAFIASNKNQLLSANGNLYVMADESDGHDIHRIDFYPDAPVLEYNAIDENIDQEKTGAYFVSVIKSRDLDGDPITYGFSVGSGDVHNTSFHISNDSLYLNAPPSAESLATYSILIYADDGSGSLNSQQIITINDINDMPTKPIFSGSGSLNENEPIGSFYKSVSATDEDGDIVTFMLVAGDGDDNSKFTLIGDSITNAVVLDYDTQSTYKIRVQSGEANGGYNEAQLSFSINNIDELPTFNSGIADTIKEGFLYSEILDVSDPEGDELTLTINSGPAWLQGIETSDSVKNFAGTGAAGNPNGMFREDAQISNPEYLTMHNSVLYFISNHQIFKIENDTVKVVAGTGVAAHSIDGSVAKASPINDPRGITFNASGDLLFGENGSHKIRKIDPRGVLRDYIGNGNQGFSGDGQGDPTLVEMDGVSALFYDDVNARLYWSSSVDERIRVQDSNGINTIINDASIIDPRQFCYDRDGGSLYLVDAGAHKVFRVETESTPYLSVVAGTGAAGFSGDAGDPISAQLNKPVSILCEKNTLFIADTDNHRIRYINWNSSVIKTAAGTGSLTYNGDDFGYLTNLNTPSGLAKENGGKIYFSEAGGNRIRGFKDKSLLITGTPMVSDTGVVLIELIAATVEGGADTLSQNVYVAFENSLPDLGVDRVINLSEGTAFPTMFDSLFATDSDPLDIVTLDLFSNADPGIFELDTANRLNLIGSLDRETSNQYVLGVRAYDSTGYDTIQVTINVDDVNDNPPVIEDTTLLVGDSLIAAVDIGQLVYTDADTVGGHVFTILTTNSWFDVSTDGMVFTKSALSLLPDTVLVLDYEVDDGLVKDTAQLSVQVSNGINAKPSFGSDRVIHYMENTAFPDIIDSIFASDTDPYDNLTYTFLTNPAPALFELSSDNKLKTLANIDREIVDSYNLYFKVGDGLKYDTLLITINVDDENDNPSIAGDTTVFVDDTLNFALDIVDLPFSDPDTISSRTFAFITGTPWVSLSVDGMIYSQQAFADLPDTTLVLDYEIIDGVFKDTAQVQIVVSNTLNSAPDFGADRVINLNENEAIPSVIDSLFGTDVDPYDNHSYSMIVNPDPSIFEFNANDQLKLIGLLDRETVDSYVLHFEMSDGLLQDTMLVTINVQDVNDNPPIASDTATTIDDSLSVGETVIQVGYSDPDSAQTISFYFTESNSLFAIDPNGVIRVNSSLALLADTTMVLGVTVDDGASFTVVNVSIAIMNVLNAKPDFGVDRNILISEVENFPRMIDSLWASDSDLDDQLTYSVILNPDPVTFEFDSENKLNLVAALDYESVKEYILAFEVSDGLDNDTIQIKVEVSNVNDENPIVKSDTIKLLETHAPQSHVYKVEVSDPDSLGETFTYSILSGNDLGYFEIDPVSGDIKTTFGSFFEFDSASLFTLKIEVKDGVNVGIGLLEVLIEEVINEDPVFAQLPEINLDERVLQGLVLDATLEYRAPGDLEFTKGTGQFYLLLPGDTLEVRVAAIDTILPSPIKRVFVDYSKPHWAPDWNVFNSVGIVEISPIKTSEKLKGMRVEVEVENADGFVDVLNSDNLDLYSVSLISGVNSVRANLFLETGELVASWSDLKDVDLEGLVEMPAVDSNTSTWTMGGFGNYNSSFDLGIANIEYIYAWRENNSDHDLLAKYRKIKPEDIHEPGRGYWLFQEEAIEFYMPRQVRAVPVSRTLSNTGNGWHQIANPYSFAVDVAAIEPKGLEYYSWNRKTFSYEKATTSLDPRKGYWVYVESDTKWTINPVPTKISETSPSAGARVSNGSEINLSLFAGEYSDVNNSISLGEEKLQKMDMPASMDDEITLSLVDGSKLLMKDHKSSNEAAIWNLKVRSTVSGVGKGRIRFGGLETLLQNGSKISLRTLTGNEVEIKNSSAEVKLSEAGENYQIQIYQAGSNISWDFSHKVNQSEVQVELVSYESNQEVHFEVFDPKGELVYTETASSEKTLVFRPFNDLTGGNGFYHYKIHHNGKTKVGKILRY